MSKKKSYMNHTNILEEGFFTRIFKSFGRDKGKKLKKLHAKFKKDNEGLKRSNVNCWHSKPFKFEKGNAAHNFALKIENCIFDLALPPAILLEVVEKLPENIFAIFQKQNLLLFSRCWSDF